MLGRFTPGGHAFLHSYQACVAQLLFPRLSRFLNFVSQESRPGIFVWLNRFFFLELVMNYYFLLLDLGLCVWLVFRGEGRKKEREKQRCERETLVHGLLNMTDQGPNLQPGTCHDQELNQPPFASWDEAQPTEPHQSGL